MTTGVYHPGVAAIVTSAASLRNQYLLEVHMTSHQTHFDAGKQIGIDDDLMKEVIRANYQSCPFCTKEY